MRNEQFVKEYFRKDGTVAQWWNPAEGDYAYLFAKQLELIKNWLGDENKKSCLEVSCGKGRATKQLSGLFDDYLATDISNEMLSIAKTNCQGARFELQDAENLRIDSESKDCVVCLEALVHYPNPQRAIAEFNRVLRPGGIFIVDSDNKYSIRRWVKKAYQIVERSQKQFGEDIFQPYSKKELVNMLQNHGFKIEKLMYVGTVSPISVHTKKGNTFTIIGSELSRKCYEIGLDSVPLLNRLATYHLVLARK
jgi:ubiquinone/menaquinone biosynthesis C-methylase UbiE